MTAGRSTPIADREYARLIWRKWAAGEIADEQAQFLVGAGPDPKAPSPPPEPPRLPRAPRLPNQERKRRLEQRKKLAAGVLPPDLIGDLTTADLAVAAVIARFARMPNGCTLSMANLAERALVAPRTAQLAVRKLDQRRLISCLCRKRTFRVNETNLIVVASVRWREHLRERAAIDRFRVVQKSAPKEVDIVSTSELHCRRQKGLTGKRRFQPLSDKADAWLAPFRSQAGACLNPTSILLRDALPLTRLLLAGCNRADLMAGIRQVANRHAAAGRQHTIWTWDYFNQAILAERKRREARLSTPSSP